jgi:Family of unknown function (DUF6098)
VPARIRSLEQLGTLVTRARSEAYVRWTNDIARDLRTGASRDELTGIELAGLSVNPLAVEDWWDDRPMTTWVARRLYD